VSEVTLGGRSRPKIRQPNEVIKLYLKGYSTVELAKMFGVTPQAIWGRLKAAGYNRDRKLAQHVRRLKEKGVRQLESN